MNDGKQVPLRELLRGVPLNARLVIDDADGKSTTYIPVGRYCHDAADILERITTVQMENDELYQSVNRWFELNGMGCSYKDVAELREIFFASIKEEVLQGVKQQLQQIGVPRITAEQVAEIKRLADVMTDRADGDSRLYFEARAEFHAALDTLIKT